jgi:hypothetical protein
MTVPAISTSEAMTNYEIADAFVNINNEDDLTKAVFGCLELMSPSALNAILAAEKFDFTFASSPDFTFHEQVEDREPDVILEDNQDLTIMVEAKAGAPTNIDQLGEEYKELTDGWETATQRLLHVTETRLRPSQLEQVDEVPAEDLIWTSWRELAIAVMNIDENAVSSVDKRLLKLLEQVFDQQGISPFAGFTLMTQDTTFEEQLRQAYELRKQYYENINTFRKDVETYLTDDVDFWRFFRRGIGGKFYSGQKSFPSSSDTRIPRNLWFSYVPTGTTPDLTNKKHRENYLFLDFNSKTGTLRAGYTVTTKPGKVQDDIFRRTLHNRRDTVLKILEERELQPYTTSYGFATKCGSMKEIKEFLTAIGDNSYDYSSLGKRFLITRTWSADELPIRLDSDMTVDTTSVIKDVAEAINTIHKLTAEECREIFHPEVN